MIDTGAERELGDTRNRPMRSGQLLRAVRDWAAHALVSAAVASLVLFASNQWILFWIHNPTATFEGLRAGFLRHDILQLAAQWALMTFAGLTVLGTIRYFYVARRFQRTLRELEERREVVWSPQVESDWVLMRKTAEDAAKVPFAGAPAPSPRPEVPAPAEDAAIYLRGIELRNIRCFENFAVGLEGDEGPYLTTVILGDNAAGKSTLLRSMALGLCQESDAVTLMRSLTGSFLRKGTDKGSIVLHLRSARGEFTGETETTIERLNGESSGSGHGRRTFPGTGSSCAAMERIAAPGTHRVSRPTPPGSRSEVSCPAPPTY
jgi:hypothetical protein